MDISIVFKHRIKLARHRSGMSQLELANKMCIPRTTLASIENGKYCVSLDNLYKISTILNVSLDYLIGLTEKMRPDICEPQLIKPEELGQLRKYIKIANKILNHSGTDSQI